MRPGEVPDTNVFRQVVVEPRPTQDYFWGRHTIGTEDLVPNIPDTLVRIHIDRDGKPLEVLTPPPAGTVVIDGDSRQYVTRSGELRDYEPPYIPLIVRWRQFRAERQLAAAEKSEGRVSRLRSWVGSLIFTRRGEEAAPQPEPRARGLEALPGYERFVEFDIKAPYANTVSYDQGLGGSVGRHTGLEILLAMDRERRLQERQGQAPAPAASAVRESAIEDMDEVVLTDIGQALGAAGFVNAYQLTHDFPQDRVAKVVFNTLQGYRKAFQRGQFDHRLAARYSRLLQIAAQNNIPIAPLG